jgi:hypothetical protein
LVQLSHSREGIDLRRRLVVSQADDAGKAQGKPAPVAVGTLDGVEGDLDDGLVLTHRERVVGEDAAAFAVTPLPRRDNHVESGQWSLELEPGRLDPREQEGPLQPEAPPLRD